MPGILIAYHSVQGLHLAAAQCCSLGIEADYNLDMAEIKLCWLPGERFTAAVHYPDSQYGSRHFDAITNAFKLVHDRLFDWGTKTWDFPVDQLESFRQTMRDCAVSNTVIGSIQQRPPVTSPTPM